MGLYGGRFGPHNPEGTYVEHAYREQTYDTGEVLLNFAVLGDPATPPLLLIPGQTESWWGYESAMPMLAERFRVYAVDLRGQGRSTRTPGRYTLDNMGNDLVRFIDGVIGGPTWVSGLSSGGVLSSWVSAYAKPGQVIGAHYEDPPLFASEIHPEIGPDLRHGIGAMFAMWSKWLGDQWSIGDWDGMLGAVESELPSWLAAFAGAMAGSEPPQNLKEYDPEWARAFWTGTVGRGCEHARMLAAVKVPVLFTHHFRTVDEERGLLIGAISDPQAARVRHLVERGGQPFEYRSFPTMGHAMHAEDPGLFTSTLFDWVDSHNS